MEEVISSLCLKSFWSITRFNHQSCHHQSLIMKQLFSYWLVDAAHCEKNMYVCLQGNQTLQYFAMLRFATSTQHLPITANSGRCRNFIQQAQLSRKFDQSVVTS